jgi:ribosomal protein S18 acetylase RimI-like enzyme
MRVRPIRDEDLEAVARLATELGYSAARSDLAGRLPALRDSPSHAIVVAELAGEVIGWIHVEVSRALIHDPFGEIVSLVVDASTRDRGIGAALVRSAEAWARSRGLRRLRVRCRVERERAHRFYQREGFALEKTSKVLSKNLEAVPDR